MFVSQNKSRVFVKRRQEDGTANSNAFESRLTRARRDRWLVPVPVHHGPMGRMRRRLPPLGRGVAVIGCPMALLLLALLLWGEKVTPSQGFPIIKQASGQAVAVGQHVVKLSVGGGFADVAESSSGEGSSEAEDRLPGDMELMGDRLPSPDEHIPEELLIPAPPPPRYVVDYAAEYPDMCVRRTVRVRGTTFKESFLYWGRLDTFGLTKESAKRNRNAGWDMRSQAAAEWVKPGSTVLDLGCGPLMQVRDFLPPNCTYLPSDVVPRTDDPADTYICDLNAGMYPSVVGTDVVMALGVAEYINDPVFFLTSVARLYAPARVILTYVVRSKLYQKHDQLFLTREYILRVMEKNGYKLIKVQNTIAGQPRQHLFVWDFVGKEAIQAMKEQEAAEQEAAQAESISLPRKAGGNMNADRSSEQGASTLSLFWGLAILLVVFVAAAFVFLNTRVRGLLSGRGNERRRAARQ